ncbi:MAG: Smr/MutS family protein [Rhodobacteraceae bacterium]|nr:Smr/MutS family protein [Paracoccaceae bacterium]
MPRKPRRPRPEEIALWARAMQGARAMQARPVRDEPPPPDEGPPPPAGEGVAPPPRFPVFRIGEAVREPAIRTALAPSISARLAGAPVRMDRKAFRQLARGKLAPEAKLDLHGMTLAEAQPALLRFVLASHAAGRRLVLVVTGKGRDRDEGGPIPAPRGALRHAVPHWLSQPPLAGVVLQVAEAHRRHGGGGAFYVYLRRRG